MNSKDDASFAQTALVLCGIAARHLNWKPAEFWPATPAELAHAISEPESGAPTAPPSRNLIVQLMERDNDR